MAEPQDPSKESPQEPPKEPPKKGGPPDVISYDRFKEVNDRAKTLEAQVKQLTDQLKAGEDAKKTEIEVLTETVKTLQGDFDKERKQRMRLEVITKHGLPAALANRLQGDDLESLEADAESLKAFIKIETPPGVPPVPPKKGKAAGFEIEGKSPAEIREAYKDGKIKLTQ